MAVMSSFLRFARIIRTSRTPRPNNISKRPMASHFFISSQSPSQLSLARSRFYSSRSFLPGGGSQEQANKNILYSLMGANLAIFGYAMYLKAQAQQGFPQPFYKFFNNMTLNLTDFRNGRWWTLVTANFTHISIGHIFSNMFTAYFLGGFLAASPLITPGRYLIIALGSAVSGAVGWLYNRSLQTRGSITPDYSRGLGFSGAVMGISSVAACLAPSARVLIYGIVPVPLWGLVAGYAVYDGYYLNSENSRVGHAGHLGGLVFGLVYYFARLRRVRL